MVTRGASGERLRALRRDMEMWVGPRVLHRGWAYYEEGRVLHVEMQGDTIEATVHGHSGAYNTRVDIANFERSTCDCPFDGFCKHMVAVVFAAAEEDPASVQAAGAYEGVNPEDVIEALSALNEQQLRDVVALSLRDRPDWARHMKISLDRWESTQSARTLTRTMTVEEAAVYFTAQVKQILEQAEGLCEVEEWEPGLDRGYDRWGDPDDGADRWDCREAVRHVQHWCDQLEELARDAVVPALIGLGVTAVSVSQWISRFPEEAQFELDAAQDRSLAALDRVAALVRRQVQAEAGEWTGAAETASLPHQGQPVVQPETGVRRQVIRFTDWIAGQCADMLDLVDWTDVLSACILDGAHLRQFKARMQQKRPDFLSSGELCQPAEGLSTSPRPWNESGRDLIEWWCTLCIRYGEMDEAESTVDGRLSDVRSSTVRRLAEAFSAIDQHEKAVSYGEWALRLDPRPGADAHEWLARIYEAAGLGHRAAASRENALLASPTWARFQACLKDVRTDDLGREKTRLWADAVRRAWRIGLACRMLWEIGDEEEAWRVLENAHISAYARDDDLLAFLHNATASHPARCISVYQRFVDECIGRKSRSAYKDAVRWMRSLREVYMKAGWRRDWTAYMENLLEQYHRYRALKDEIHRAGLA